LALTISPAWTKYAREQGSITQFRRSLLHLLVAASEEFGDKSCTGEVLFPAGSLVKLVEPETCERLARRLSLDRIGGRRVGFEEVWSGFVRRGEAEEAYLDALRELDEM
jgi:hypothetical protein